MKINDKYYTSWKLKVSSWKLKVAYWLCYGFELLALNFKLKCSTVLWTSELFTYNKLLSRIKSILLILWISEFSCLFIMISPHNPLHLFYEIVNFSPLVLIYDHFLLLHLFYELVKFFVFRDSFVEAFDFFFLVFVFFWTPPPTQNPNLRASSFLLSANFILFFFLVSLVLWNCELFRSTFVKKLNLFYLKLNRISLIIWASELAKEQKMYENRLYNSSFIWTGELAKFLKIYVVYIDI